MKVIDPANFVILSAIGSERSRSWPPRAAATRLGRSNNLLDSPVPPRSTSGKGMREGAGMVEVEPYGGNCPQAQPPWVAGLSIVEARALQRIDEIAVASLK